VHTFDNNLSDSVNQLKINHKLDPSLDGRKHCFQMKEDDNGARCSSSSMWFNY